MAQEASLPAPLMVSMASQNSSGCVALLCLAGADGAYLRLDGNQLPALGLACRGVARPGWLHLPSHNVAVHFPPSCAHHHSRAGVAVPAHGPQVSQDVTQSS